MNSIKTIIMIGGFVTLFSVIITLLDKTRVIVFLSNLIGNSFNIDSSLINASISGLIEFTNGLNQLSNIHLKNISTNICISAFLIGFGGISITLQVLSIISKHHLSIKKYIVWKFFHAIIAFIYTYIILQIPIFNFNL